MAGDSLDSALVQAAQALEVEYPTKMKVYDVVSRREFKKCNRGKWIKGRWLAINRGDSVSPDIRSRYVDKAFVVSRHVTARR